MRGWDFFMRSISSHTLWSNQGICNSWRYGTPSQLQHWGLISDFLMRILWGSLYRILHNKSGRNFGKWNIGKYPKSFKSTLYYRNVGYVRLNFRGFGRYNVNFEEGRGCNFIGSRYLIICGGVWNAIFISERRFWVMRNVCMSDGWIRVLLLAYCANIFDGSMFFIILAARIARVIFQAF